MYICSATTNNDMEIQDFKIDAHTALMTLIAQDGEGYASTVEFMKWLVKAGYARSFIAFCDMLIPYNGRAMNYRDLLNNYGHDQLMDWIQQWTDESADVEWHIQEQQHEQVYCAEVLDAEDKKYKLGRMKAMREAILWTLKLKDGRQCTALVNRSLQTGTIRVGDNVQVKGELEKTKYGLQIKAKSISPKV